MNKLPSLVVGLGICLTQWVAEAQTSSTVGRIVAATQELIAVDIADNSREILRRSEIYTGESIHTAGTGYALIRMSDGALIALGCNSSLEIQSYDYSDSQNDSVIINLLKGRLRTVTGAVNKIHLANYRLNLNGAWANTDGADFEATLLEDGSIYFAVYDGIITVSNSLGALTLGADQDVDFARLEAGQPPTPLRFYPQQLSLLTLSTTPTSQTGSTCQ